MGARPGSQDTDSNTCASEVNVIGDMEMKADGGVHLDFQRETAMSLPYVNVNQVLFDHLIRVNSNVARLVYEITCMSQELYNLRYDNYKLKEELFHKQRSNVEYVKCNKIAPNDAHNEPQNANPKINPIVINDTVAVSRKQEKAVVCQPPAVAQVDNSVQCASKFDVVERNVQPPLVMRRRLSRRIKRSMPSTILYRKGRLGSVLDLFCIRNITMLPTKVRILFKTRKRRRVKKYRCDESDENYIDK